MTTVANEAWFRDPALQSVLSLLNADGGAARVVGGAVRNSLMGFDVSDIDIATTLLPEAVIERAKAAGIKSVPTGLAHGTVTLVASGQPFEVTTLRRDVATDGRHAQVAFGAGWQEDAERRDLTINALFADASGTVIDLVGGVADIESRTVRFIGDAETRIAEDYLRVLRFFRFFAHYGHGRPDAAGLRACAAARSKLNTLSVERIWSELKKLLAATDPGRALLWMRQTGVLGEILPESEKWGIDAVPGLIAAERRFGWSADPMLRLAAIVPPDLPRLTAMASRLKLANSEAACLEAWAKAPVVPEAIADTAFDRLLYAHGSEGLTMQLKLTLAGHLARTDGMEPEAMRKTLRLQALIERCRAWSKPVFPLKGADVLAAGVAPGPTVGELLATLERAWVDGNFSLDRTALLARLRRMVDDALRPD